MHRNPEEYINNPLNISLSKEAHSFSKAERFRIAKRIQTQVKYTLPSSITKKTCTFGFGCKASMVEKRCSPPPGTYQPLSDFDTDRIKLNTPLFRYGREDIKFGSYLQQAENKGKKLPSPSKYNIKANKNRLGGNIGIRLRTQFDVKQDKDLPGPGNYTLHSIDMANSSSFHLSNYKHFLHYYHQTSSIQLQGKRKRNHSALFYDISQKQFGKSVRSKFRNVTTTSFGKAKREGLIEKWRLGTPGYKYNSFSEFGRIYN